MHVYIVKVVVSYELPGKHQKHDGHELTIGALLFDDAVDQAITLALRRTADDRHSESGGPTAEVLECRKHCTLDAWRTDR